MKKWNGSRWVDSRVRRWDGSRWVDASFRRWNGSSWVGAYGGSVPPPTTGTGKPPTGNTNTGTSKPPTNSGGGNTSTLPKKLKTYTVNAIWSGVYDKNGNRRLDRGTTLQQGLKDGDAKNGISKSLIAFGELHKFKNKEIKYIRLGIHTMHWYYEDGGQLWLGWHGASVAPNKFSEYVNGAVRYKTKKGSFEWIDMPASFIKGIKDGSVKGVSINKNEAGWHAYGLFGGYGAMRPPKLNIGYYE